MIKRYDCYYLNDFNDDYSALSREAADGEWVLYDDHAARVAELEAENKVLRAKLLPMCQAEHGPGTCSLLYCRTQMQCMRDTVPASGLPEAQD